MNAPEVPCVGSLYRFPFLRRSVAVPAACAGMKPDCGWKQEGQGKRSTKRRDGEGVAGDTECADKAKGRRQDSHPSRTRTARKGRVIRAKAARSRYRPGTRRLLFADSATTSPPGKGVWSTTISCHRSLHHSLRTSREPEVGDFPRRLCSLKDVEHGSRQRRGKPMLRAATAVPSWKLPRSSPSVLTVEVTYHSPSSGNPMYIRTTDDGGATTPGCYGNMAFANTAGRELGNGIPGRIPPTGFVNRRFTIDNGRGIKAYVDEHRTGNLPQGVATYRHPVLQLPGDLKEDPTMVASIRVAAGGKKLYDALAATWPRGHAGHPRRELDHIRPESTPTLKEIGEMLQQHADLKLPGTRTHRHPGTGSCQLLEKAPRAVRQYSSARTPRLARASPARDSVRRNPRRQTPRPKAARTIGESNS